MPPTCIVKGCGNKYNRKYQVSSVTLHTLPKSNTKLRVWLKAINWQEDWEPDPFNTHYRICSKHFSSDSFIHGKKSHFLKSSAVPSVFEGVEVQQTPRETTFDFQTDVHDSLRFHNYAKKSQPDEVISNLTSQLTCDVPGTSTIQVDAIPPVESEIEVACDLVEDVSEQALQSEPICATPTGSAPMVDTPKRLKHKPTSLNLRRKLDFLRPGRSKKNKTEEGGSALVEGVEHERLLKQLRVYKIKEKIRKKRMNAIRMRNNRAREKIDVLKSMMEQLRSKGLSETGAEAVNSCLSGTLAGTLVTELLNKGKKGSKIAFCDELKVFATTLHFHSPKAYEYVRSKLMNILPHPKTIARWFRSFDGSPGFSDHALCVLQAKKNANPERTLYCSLMFDEMNIRKHIEYDCVKQKFIGRVDMGDHSDDDSLPEAREALVFMISCLNEGWKLPIGYFLTAGLSAEDKRNLVKRSLLLLYDHGAEIVSLTFDGTQTNMSMAKKLGAFPDHPYHTSYFEHPSDPNKKVFIFPDPCHMLKLVRNAFSDKKTLYAGKGTGEIKWEYIEALNEIQKREGLVLANRLKDTHVHFQKQKMKVKLAAQLFSRSVVTGLEYCRLKKFDGFSDSAHTELFFMAINDLFDILNAYLPNGPFFKGSLQQTNSTLIFGRLQEIESVLEGLYISDSPQKEPVSVLNSSRKTGFLGFLICIQSLRGLYDYLIGSNKIEYLLTYALSQDHLEMFFGVIRSKGGFNDNPTARQFATAYTRLLVRNELKAIKTGNCVPQEHFTFLFDLAKQMHDEAEKQDLLVSNPSQKKFSALSLTGETPDHEYLEFSDTDCLSIFAEDVITYVAGFVARKIIHMKAMSCTDCRNFILYEENSEHNLDDLISVKSYRPGKGQLCRPSAVVNHLCRFSERFYRMVLASSNGVPAVEGLEDQILQSIFESDWTEEGVFQKIVEHDQHFSDDKKHGPAFIRRIVRLYLKIRLSHYARSRNSQTKAATLRQVNKKSTIFNGN